QPQARALLAEMVHQPDVQGLRTTWTEPGVDADELTVIGAPVEREGLTQRGVGLDQSGQERLTPRPRVEDRDLFDPELVVAGLDVAVILAPVALRHDLQGEDRRMVPTPPGLDRVRQRQRR